MIELSRAVEAWKEALRKYEKAVVRGDDEAAEWRVLEFRQLDIATAYLFSIGVPAEPFDGEVEEAVAVGQVSESVRWAVFERDNFTCKRCGKRQKLTVDHIHPRSLGGTNSPENLQTLCRRCNCSKGARE